MIINYLHKIGWFVGLVLLQVLILNNVHIAGYATPFLYIYLILKFGLCTVQKAFPGQAARTDSNLRLIYVISRSCQVLFHAQQNLNANLLVRFQYFIEKIVAGVEKTYRTYGKQTNKKITPMAFTQSKEE
jgi:hypothetical protein